jgi:hypothetical protein
MRGTLTHGHFSLNIYERENALRVRVYYAFKFALKLIVFLDKLNFDDEGELATLLPLRLTDDVSTELPD